MWHRVEARRQGKQHPLIVALDFTACDKGWWQDGGLGGLELQGARDGVASFSNALEVTDYPVR